MAFGSRTVATPAVLAAFLRSSSCACSAATDASARAYCEARSVASHSSGPLPCWYAPAQSADMVAPKPAKRKKAKFLEPEAGHLE